MVPLAESRTVRPAPSPRRRVVRCLLAVLVLLAGMPAAPVRAEGARWQWPLPAPHEVLAPYEAPAHRYGPGHRGIDVAAAPGEPVRAVEAGTVRFRGTVAGRGVVSVRHADGLLSTYEPVRATVEAGDAVEAGDVLGVLEQAGEQGHCPGATCLHLGARRGEDYLDPSVLLGALGPSVLLPWGGGARTPFSLAAAALRPGDGPGPPSGAASPR